MSETSLIKEKIEAAFVAGERRYSELWLAANPTLSEDSDKAMTAAHAARGFATGLMGYKAMLLSSLEVDEAHDIGAIERDKKTMQGAYRRMKNPMDKDAFGVILQELSWFPDQEIAAGNPKVMER